MVHGVSGVPEGGLQLARQIDVVLDKQNPHSVVPANPARTAVDLDIRDAAAGIFPAHHIVVATLAHAQHPTGTARLDSAGHVAGVGARAAVATRRIAQSLAWIAAGLLPAILIAIPVAA